MVTNTLGAEQKSRNTEAQRTQSLFFGLSSVISVPLCFKTGSTGSQFAESAKLEAAIKANLEGLGYGE